MSVVLSIWMFWHPCINSISSINMLATSPHFLATFGLRIAALPSYCESCPIPGYHAIKAHLSLPSHPGRTFVKYLHSLTRSYQPFQQIFPPPTAKVPPSSTHIPPPISLPETVAYPAVVETRPAAGSSPGPVLPSAAETPGN